MVVVDQKLLDYVQIEGGETADRAHFVVPDDDAWLAFRARLDAAGFWGSTSRADHSEPQREAVNFGRETGC